VTDDLTGTILALSDDDAVAALAFAADAEDASSAETDELRDVEGRLPEAFADSDDLAALDLPDGPAATVTPGDLARSALLYLAGRAEDRPVVERAVARPRREGQRDPLTIAVIGLAVFALRSDVELKRTTTGKWSFHFRMKPMKDAQIVDVLAKLWALVGGGPAGGAPNGGAPTGGGSGPSGDGSGTGAAG
jgi:hypothetical protein